MKKYLRLSALVTTIVGTIIAGIFLDLIHIPASKSNIDKTINTAPKIQTEINDDESVKNDQQINIKADNSNVDITGNKTVVNNNKTVINNLKQDENIRITSFKLKKMATCVVRRDTPVPVEFDWSYEGGNFDIKELDVRYSWSNADLAYSKFNPDNPLLIMPNAKEETVTAYLYIKAPNGAVATANYSFYIINPKQ